MKDLFQRKKITLFASFLIFSILGFIALKIPFRNILGSDMNFTLFDFFAPTAASFFGGTFGVISVILMRLIHTITTGASFDKTTIILFIPAIFGTLYFAKKNKLNLIIPALAMLLFIVHPIGKNVWYYSLFWLIPIAAYFFREKSLYIRSLGSTFTQHAIGGVLWLYAFNLPEELWISLIPIVFLERFIIAGGISLSYVLFNNIFALIKKNYGSSLIIGKKYLLSNLKSS